MNKVYLGDVVNVIIDTLVDVTSASRYIKYLKPDGSNGYTSASIVDGTLTKIQSNMTFDKVGIWKVQPYLEFPNNTRFHGTHVIIEVLDRLANNPQ